MPLRWGIVGAGRISSDFVKAVSIIPKDEGHQVVAVASQNLSRAQEFANKLGIPTAYGDYVSLANSKDVDVVYVGNLNTQHFEVSKLMMNSGKSILCEKPLTMNEKQTRELVEHAQRNKVFLMEAVWSRCFPVYEELRKMIKAGTLGDIYYVHVAFGFDLTQKSRLTSKELGGGTILDLGVYTLQFQQMIFGAETPLKFAATGHLNQDGVDESASAIITYSNGRTAIISNHSRVKLPNEALVVGTKGTVRIPFFWCPDTLITDSKTLKFELPNSDGVEFAHNHSVGLSYEAQEVKRCIDNGLLESSKITQKETVQLAHLMDTWRQAVGVVFPEDN